MLTLHCNRRSDDVRDTSFSGSRMCYWPNEITPLSATLVALSVFMFSKTYLAVEECVYIFFISLMCVVSVHPNPSHLACFYHPKFCFLFVFFSGTCSLQIMKLLFIQFSLPQVKIFSSSPCFQTPSFFLRY